MVSFGDAVEDLGDTGAAAQGRKGCRDLGVRETGNVPTALETEGLQCLVLDSLDDLGAVVRVTENHSSVRREDFEKGLECEPAFRAFFQKLIPVLPLATFFLEACEC